jgi:hypothetical protein
MMQKVEKGKKLWVNDPEINKVPSMDPHMETPHMGHPLIPSEEEGGEPKGSAWLEGNLSVAP